MQRKLIWVGMLTIAAVAFGAAFLLITNKPALHGAVINPPLSAAEIHLTDYNGSPYALSEARGKVVVLYFGYTNCPSECPLTMAHLKLARQQMGAQGQDVQVVMISTDPKRDTPEAMKAFLTKFSPDFVGLVGPQEQLAKVWHDYGVTVEDGGETHSYFVYVIDPQGRFRETFLPDSDARDMAADFALLAKGY